MSERKSGYMLLWASLAVVLTLVLSVVINVRLVKASELRSCETLMAQINAYIETPPERATGKNIERAYREQYARYHCSPQPRPARVAPSASRR